MLPIVIDANFPIDEKTARLFEHMRGDMGQRFPGGDFYLPPPEEIVERKYPLNGAQKVVIAGGGYAGSVTAIALLKENPLLDVTMIEVRSPGRCVGGPCTCKGCMGGISARGVEIMKGLGIEFPDDIFIGRADRIRYINAWRLPRLEDYSSVPAPTLLFASHGSGPAGLHLGTEGHNISLARFLRDEAQKRGVKLVTGTVTHIVFPEYRSHPAYVRCEAGRDAVVLGADLVVNAIGVNGKGIDLIRYHPDPTDGKIIAGKIAVSTPRAHFAGVFELPITQDGIDRLGLRPDVFDCWYGIPDTEAVLTMLKQAQGKKWLTVVVSPVPALMQRAPDDKSRKEIVNGIFRTFLERTGASSTVGDRLVCQCLSKIPVDVAIFPGVRNYPGHRYVMVGDASGVVKFKKCGIAFLIECSLRIAKAAVSRGVNGDDLASAHDTFAAGVDSDNIVGRLLFAASGLVNRSATLSRLHENLLKIPFVRNAIGEIVMGHTGPEARYTTSGPIAAWKGACAQLTRRGLSPEALNKTISRFGALIASWRNVRGTLLPRTGQAPTEDVENGDAPKSSVVFRSQGNRPG